MSSYTSDFQVVHTRSAQHYRDVVANTLLSSSFQSFPLLAPYSHPSLALLQYLHVEIVPFQSSLRSTDYDLWQLYNHHLQKDTPPPDVHELYHLINWYKRTLPHTKHVVIVLEDTCFSAAILYASYHKLPLVQINQIDIVKDVVDLLEPNYLTLIATVKQLSHDSLQRLHNRIGQAQIQKTAWQQTALGLLTGRDLSSVSWSVLKATGLPTLLPPLQQVVTLHTGRDTKLTSVDLYGRDASFEAVMPVISKNDAAIIPDLLLIESHGGEHYIHFNTGVLCGRAADESQISSETASLLQPSCACGQGCFKPHVLPAHRITAKHIFANTCDSLQLSPTIYPSHYSLGLNAIESMALTYVGTTLLNDGKNYEIFLYAAALRSGMTVGDAVRLLNNLPKRYFPTCYTYVLAGNPQSYALQSKQSMYREVFEQEAEQQWHITVEVEVTALITLEIPQICTASDTSYFCRLHPLHESSANLPNPLYFTFAFHDNHATIYLYPSEGYIEAGTYHFAVSSFSTDIQARVNRVLRAYQSVISTHLLSEQMLKNRIRQIEQLFTRLGKQLSHIILHGETTIQAIPPIEQTLHSLEQQLKQADQDLLLLLIQLNGNKLYPYYSKVLDSFVPYFVNGSFPCLCGNDMTLQIMQHIVFDSQLLGGFCSRCGVVYHGPNNGIFAIWHRISLPVDGQEWTADILFRNTTSYTVTGYAGIALLLPHLQKVHGEVQYDPQQLFLSLAPQETKIQQFRLRTQGLISLDYELLGYFVSDLTIYCMHRELFLASPEHNLIQS